MQPAGYLINTKNGLEGTRGIVYDYILAGNGIFLEANSDLLSARINLASLQIRGLNPISEMIILPKGKIPAHLLTLITCTFSLNPDRECLAAIYWNGNSYRINIPPQKRYPGSVEYQPVPNTILDIHSHGIMPAFFSSTDDNDDQGFKLSAVLGKMDQPDPEILVRISIYGYHKLIDPGEIFNVYT